MISFASKLNYLYLEIFIITSNNELDYNTFLTGFPYHKAIFVQT